MVIAFCGHRDYVARAGDEEKILSLLEECVGEEKCEFFLGGYGRFDSFAFTCAKNFKKKHPQARLLYITPYLPPKENHEKFDLVLYPPLENVPLRYAISHRNKWIAEQADLLIAFLHRRYGGAYAMYQCAVKNGVRIYNLASEETK